jgi:hypothetical protein
MRAKRVRLSLWQYFPLSRALLSALRSFFDLLSAYLWFVLCEKMELAQRLQLLQAQQANLERVSGRLQAFCRSLELMGRDAEAAKARVGREEAAVELAPENEDVYSRA